MEWRPDAYPYWAREQFARFKGAVGFVEVRDHEDNVSIGTCFHVGEGVFVTARHVVERSTITEIGFDDEIAAQDLLRRPENWGKKPHGAVEIISGPHFLDDRTIDVACFRARPFPNCYIPLGGHLDDYLDQYALVLHRTLVMGYPPIPMSDRPVLVASVGEINALIDIRAGRHPHFVISTMARGGFSGGPALVAYNEANVAFGTAALGVVTDSLVRNGLEAEQGYMAVLTVEPIYDCLAKHGLLPACQNLEVLNEGEGHPTPDI